MAGQRIGRSRLTIKRDSIERKDRERLRRSGDGKAARGYGYLSSTVEERSRRSPSGWRIDCWDCERARFFGVVEDGEDALFVGLTQEDVGRIVREEMPEFAAL